MFKILNQDHCNAFPFLRSSANEDYDKKLKEYQALGIPEYWVVDPEASGAVRYIEDARLPTLSVYVLIDDETLFNHWHFERLL